jgi:hypothetical protein
MRSSYEWFSSTIQTTCWYVGGGLSRQPQTGWELVAALLAGNDAADPLHATIAASMATRTSTRTWRM